MGWFFYKEDDALKLNILSVLEAGLDAAALRQKVIAHNIANISTPGFKGSRVSFEVELRSWLDGAGKSSLPKPVVIQSGAQAMRPDGNTVDMDSEQVILAANLIKFQALSRQVDEQFARMRYVVTDGRR